MLFAATVLGRFRWHKSSRRDAFVQRNAPRCTATNALAGHGLVIEGAACTLRSTQLITLLPQSRVVSWKPAYSAAGCPSDPSSLPSPSRTQHSRLA